MKVPIPFFLIFIYIELSFANPQHLQQQQQIQQHLNPVNQPQLEYHTKDQSKRTIGAFRRYVLGKHVGIHPLGFKYVLGYSPINIRYLPVIKPPVTVLKPLFHHQNIQPLLKPSKQYLPQHVSYPNNDGWKPVIGVPTQIVPVEAPEALHQQRPWIENAPVNIHPDVSVKQSYNYYYYQPEPPPVAKPFVLPQVPLFHVSKPQLPVLPLGGTFPAPVLQPSQSHMQFPIQPQNEFGPVTHLHPVLPVHHYPSPAPPHNLYPNNQQPIFPVNNFHVHNPHAIIPEHHLQSRVHVHNHLPVDHSQPVSVYQHQPLEPHTHPATPFVSISQHTMPLPIDHHPMVPQTSIEFHGNHNLLPLNHQIPFMTVQFPLQFPFNKQSPQVPQVIIGRQPHLLPSVPSEVPHNNIPGISQPNEQHTPLPINFHLQAPFSPGENQPSRPEQNAPSPVNIYLQPPFGAGSIRPGETDVQLPQHLPEHPHFRQILNHFRLQGNLEPPFNSFQSDGDVVKPSVDLETPYNRRSSL